MISVPTTLTATLLSSSVSVMLFSTPPTPNAVRIKPVNTRNIADRSDMSVSLVVCFSAVIICSFELFVNQFAGQVQSHQCCGHCYHTFLTSECHDLIFQGLHAVWSGKKAVFLYWVLHSSLLCVHVCIIRPFCQSVNQKDAGCSSVRSLCGILLRGSRSCPRRSLSVDHGEWPTSGSCGTGRTVERAAPCPLRTLPSLV